MAATGLTCRYQICFVVVINASLKAPIAKWMEAQSLATLNPFYRQTVWVDFMLVFGSMSADLLAALCASRPRPGPRSAAVPITAAQAAECPVELGHLKRYVIPNALGPLIVSVSAGLAATMFCGKRLQLPRRRRQSAHTQLRRHDLRRPACLAALSAPAGITAVLGLASVAFSFLGDGLNDALVRGVQIMNTTRSAEKLLDVHGLTVEIDSGESNPAVVVDGIDLHVNKGETLGVVNQIRLQQEPDHAEA